MHKVCRLVAVVMACGFAATSATADPSAPAYDAKLASKLGADENGMRQYVMVILKTGPTPKPRGPERDAMFKGHFANIQRLAEAGKLVLAGPFDGVDGWRGMFVFAVKDIDEAKQLTSTESGDRERRNDRRVPRVLRVGGPHPGQRDAQPHF